MIETGMLVKTLNVQNQKKIMFKTTVKSYLSIFLKSDPFDPTLPYILYRLDVYNQYLELPYKLCPGAYFKGWPWTP
jgi:hypothetical protein